MLHPCQAYLINTTALFPSPSKRSISSPIPLILREQRNKETRISEFDETEPNPNNGGGTFHLIHGSLATPAIMYYPQFLLSSPCSVS